MPGVLVPEKQQILWTAGYGDFTLRERVRAAAACGFDRMSVSSVETAALAGEPHGLAELRAFADDHGVALAVLDPVVTWLPTNPRWRYARASLDDVDRIGSALGVTALCAIAGVDHGLPHTQLVERFAALCRRAGANGWTVALEFAPGSGVPSLRAAIGLVLEADLPNASILFDSWHFYRSGGTLDDIATAPPGLIRFVQLSDAAAQLEGSLGRDTYHRRLPGDGEIELTSIVRSLDGVGALDLYGPEIIRPHADGATCLQAVAEDAEAVNRLVRNALGGGHLPQP